MSSYDALATSYDSLMVDGSYRKRADWLERLFKKSRIPVKTVLDLACGTGTIACLLAERGYQVIATDGSEEMLTQAMCKAAILEERAPLFLYQSMPKLRLTEQVDTVISTMDSLNYLTKERDIRETFRRVYRWLKDGGQFIFETEDSYCVWRTFFSEKTKVCTYQVDLFHLTEDGTWERNFEEHRERAWTEEELRTFLTEAGFDSITVTGDLTMKAPKAEEDRMIVRVIKKEKK